MKKNLKLNIRLHGVYMHSSHVLPNCIGSRPHVSMRAYNRWHVVYVLLKNPSIRDTRRSMLSELK